MAKDKRRHVGRVLIAAPLILLALVIAYVAYVMIDYHRIADWQTLTVSVGADRTAVVERGRTYTALTYNIGFGAYTPDYDCFLDGGTQSWAKSRESVIASVQGAAALAAGQEADFTLFQEVDLDSTRSYHVDERALLDEAIAGRDGVYAVNFDSPFLLYPFYQPYGQSISSLGIYSRFPITGAVRRSLPVTTGVQKYLDLDRAYIVSRVPMSDGRELVVYNIHMTAYTSDSTVRDEQLAMLVADMTAEYEAGNAAICGGDFNMEMRLREAGADTAAWAIPVDRAQMGICIDAWDAIGDEAAEQPGSCRDARAAYVPGQTVEWTLDSFLVTPNVTVEQVICMDTGFAWSDHDPVMMTFRVE